LGNIEGPNNNITSGKNINEGAQVMPWRKNAKLDLTEV
jgi:hypothetical protein